MINKKTFKGNIEKNKNTYLLIGLIFSILLIYICFEFVTSKKSVKNINTEDDNFIMVDENVKRTDENSKKIKNEFIRKDIILQITNKPITDTFNWTVWFNQPDIDIIQDTIPIILEPVTEEPPKHWVEEMPLFPGGNIEWNKYLIKNLSYPKICIDMGITGTVLISFIVEKDGTITDVKPIVSVYPDLDEAAVNVIKKSPKWIPGKQMGKPVRVYYQIPIKFTLNN